MERKLTFSPATSAQLRDLLADTLMNVFENHSIYKYLATDYAENELLVLNCCHAPAPSLPQIKLAFSIWENMAVADRYVVLGKFQSLFACLPVTHPTIFKTCVFSALFVHEFAAILAEAMEWPD